MNVPTANPRKKPIEGAILAGDTFACQQCLYNSTDRSHMARHIASKHRQATGARPPPALFACEACGDRKFTAGSSLRRHQKTCRAWQATPLVRIERLEREVAALKQAMPSYK